MTHVIVWFVLVVLISLLIYLLIVVERIFGQSKIWSKENRLGFDCLVRAIEVKDQPDQVFPHLAAAMEHFMVVEKMIKGEGADLSDEDKKVARTIVKEYLVAFALSDLGYYVEFHKMVPSLFLGKWHWHTPTEYKKEITDLHAANQAANLDIH